MYKVLIAASEMLIRMGLESLVNNDPRFYTAALTKDGEEALEAEGVGALVVGSGFAATSFCPVISQ